MKIEVNKAAVDYITVTTKSVEIADRWAEELRNTCGVEEAKIKRYEGYRGKGDAESIFIGKSVGRAAPHFILQTSGAMADLFYLYITHNEIKSGEVNVTRIDVQVTIDQPVAWSQVGYMQTCEASGLKPEIKRSRNPINRKEELITVYTGTRTSGRYNRCYQKVMDDSSLLLRYETEFSRGYAKSVAYGLLSETVTREQVVRGEIKRRKLECLRVFDLWQTGVFSPKQEWKELTDCRANWLVNDILPVFTEYINRHGADQRVVESFVGAIVARVEWGETEGKGLK